MSQIIIPEGYKSPLNLHDTQVAIKTVKDYFQARLSERLNLQRVSAPLFVTPESGLNDNLNGVEKPVEFTITCENGRKAQVVQSLAKWKRFALKKYGFEPGEGLVMDNVEETIRSIGYMGRVGMKETDVEILHVMLGDRDLDPYK